MEDKRMERWLNFRKNHIQFLIRRAGIIFAAFSGLEAIVVLPAGKGLLIGISVVAFSVYCWVQEQKNMGLDRKEYLIRLSLCALITALGALHTAVLFQLLLASVIIGSGKKGAARKALLVGSVYVLASVFAERSLNTVFIMQLMYNIVSFAVLTVAVSLLHFMVRKQLDNEHQMKRLTKENNRKQKMVMTDDLTGLYNYRAYMENIRRVSQYCLLIIDIDNFKKLNDTYGHGFGNKVLVKMGNVISQAIRGGDMAFRYGGEEFVLILPDTTISLGYKVAERLRQKVEESAFLHGKQTVTVTVSIGAAVKEMGMDSQGVFEQADSALYLAKQAGRNVVKCYEEDVVLVCRL
jgi:diguanylate cyclase (GGDEF)-like protein